MLVYRCYTYLRAVTRSIFDIKLFCVYNIYVYFPRKSMKNLTEANIEWIIAHSIKWKHSRSGGHWGQNVNKRETKAEGYFSVDSCKQLDEEQKLWLHDAYHNHISKKWVIRLTCQEQRNYHQNLSILKKHYKILLENLGKELVFDHLHHRRKRKHH